MRQKPKGKTPSQIVAARMRQVRERQGLSGTALAARLAAIGMPSFNQSVIANVESGRRDSVSVDELCAVAMALGVAPIHLLVPLDDDDLVRVGSRPLDAATARAWVRGEHPIGSDGKAYFTEVPPSEWADIVRRLLHSEELWGPVGRIETLIRRVVDLDAEGVELSKQFNEMGIPTIPAQWTEEHYQQIADLLDEIES